MKLLLFLLALSIGFHLCSCDFNEKSNELTQRRPAPPRRPPPAPPRSPPPAPPRSPPPAPPRRPPPAPPRSPPPAPPRSPPPAPPGSPPPTASPPSPGPSLPEPGFDYFTLSLIWPNAYCRVKGVTCRPSYPKQYFTIHGLWPQNNNKIPLDTCRQESTLTDAILNKQRQELLKFWPHLARANDFERSKNFWHVQWSKHGSCSSNRFTAEAYFDQALKLGSKYSPIVLKKLQAKKIKPDGMLYSSTNILAALKAVTGKNAAIACDLDASRKDVLQLLDVFLCFDSDGNTPMDCSPDLIDKKCERDLAFSFFPPSPPPRSLGIPFNVSSTLEVEAVATH